MRRYGSRCTRPGRARTPCRGTARRSGTRIPSLARQRRDAPPLGAVGRAATEDRRAADLQMLRPSDTVPASSAQARHHPQPRSSQHHHDQLLHAEQHRRDASQREEETGRRSASGRHRVAGRRVHSRSCAPSPPALSSWSGDSKACANLVLQEGEARAGVFLIRRELQLWPMADVVAKGGIGRLR
eukprot:5793580-Prymnesium_polylepis.1